MPKPIKQNISTLKRLHLLAKKMFSGDFSTPSYSPLYSTVSGVSVISIDGEIGKKLSNADKQSGKVDCDDIVKACKIAEKDASTVCILCINSPGGGSIGVREAGDAIKKLTESKTVVTFCDTICASAAYWLACCTNGIFVTPSCEVGSIGVYAKVIDYSENLKMQGINVHVFSAGSMKTMGHGDKPMSDEEAAFIQSDIDEQWKQFKTLVNDNRGGVAEETMQGQLFSGDKSIAVNLADEIVPDFDTLLAKVTTQ
jgi:signal peptide peptidase SppA